MLRHVFHPYIPWGLPGGWLGRNEDPAAGVLRELKEETGLTAVLGPVVHVAHDSNPPHVAIAFSGRVQSGSFRLSPEIMEAAWFPIDALPTSLLPFMRDAINAAVGTHSVLPIPATTLVPGVVTNQENWPEEEK